MFIVRIGLEGNCYCGLEHFTPGKKQFKSITLSFTIFEL